MINRFIIAVETDHIPQIEPQCPHTAKVFSIFSGATCTIFISGPVPGPDILGSVLAQPSHLPWQRHVFNLTNTNQLVATHISLYLSGFVYDLPGIVINELECIYTSQSGQDLPGKAARYVGILRSFFHSHAVSRYIYAQNAEIGERSPLLTTYSSPLKNLAVSGLPL